MGQRGARWSRPARADHAKSVADAAPPRRRRCLSRRPQARSRRSRRRHRAAWAGTPAHLQPNRTPPRCAGRRCFWRYSGCCKRPGTLDVAGRLVECTQASPAIRSRSGRQLAPAACPGAVGRAADCAVAALCCHAGALGFGCGGRSDPCASGRAGRRAATGGTSPALLLLARRPACGRRRGRGPVAVPGDRPDARADRRDHRLRDTSRRAPAARAARRCRS